MRFWKQAVIAFVMLTLAACVLQPRHSYRYRVTVEVDTPQGVRGGSSVWETTAWEGSGIPDRGIRSREKGEAVAVDLPGGTLFALMRSADLRSNYISGLIPAHFHRNPQPGVQFGGKDWEENIRNIAKVKPAFDLNTDAYPLLVRFRDNSDPTSVEKVDPDDLSDLGSGLRIRRIHVEVTTDYGRPRILDYLPWLETHKGALQKPPRNVPVDEHPFASRLNDGDFWRGET